MERFSLAVNRPLHVIGGLALTLLMFLTVVDVLGRYLLNMPLPGTVELTEMGMIMVVFLGLGYAQHRNDHIAIDLIYTRMPPVWQARVRLFTGLLSLALMGVMSWQLYRLVGRMSAGNYVTGVLSIPIYPFAIIAVLGALAYALALIADLVQAIRPQGRS